VVTDSTTVNRVRATFSTVGARGWLHAHDLGAPLREIDVDAGHRVPLASTYKLLVAVAVSRACDSGRLSPKQRVRLGARRTPGPTGLAAMRDPITMTVRDLQQLMIAVSDNAACDVLHDLAGDENVQAVADDLGLRSITVRGRVRDFVASIPRDLGVPPTQVAATLAQPDALDLLSALDPARTTSGSPRDLTRLLRAIWQDAAASPEACSELRRCLGLQVWPHRIAAGFPEDQVIVSGKTGSLPGLRAEAAVVEMPTDRAYGIAVFARSHPLPLNQPRVDAAIGAVARLAVHALEGQEGAPTQRATAVPAGAATRPRRTPLRPVRGHRSPRERP